MRSSTSLLVSAVLAFGAGCGGKQLDLRVPGGADYATEKGVAPQKDGSVRFFAVGDMGEPDPAATGKLHPNGHKVANLVGEVCKAKGGCDFGTFLGDNVYLSGVHSTDPGDPTAQLFDDIVKTYQDALGGRPTPLYFILGNHDWGPAFPSRSRADTELEMVKLCHDKGLECRGAHHFYEFRAGPVEMHAWDTNALVRQCDDSGTVCGLEGDDTLGRREPCKGDDCPVWRIAMGHHPYLSDGLHGDAGSFLESIFRLWPGRGFKTLMDRHVIGYTDLYLCGHEHDMEVFLEPNPGRPDMGGRHTALVVSGAGVKTSPLVRDRADYGRARLGFALVEASKESLVVEIYTTSTGMTKPEFRIRKRRGKASFEIDPAVTPPKP